MDEAGFEELLKKIDWKKFEDIIKQFFKTGYRKGQKAGTEEGGKRWNPEIGDNEWINQMLNERVTVLSQNTQARLVGNLKKAIMEGVAARESTFEIRERIQKEFKNLKGWEAERIARTEVIAGVNLGREEGWMNSDVKWKMWWSGRRMGDKRLCDTCKALMGQIQEVGKPFVDLGTGNVVEMPPIHPNDRCTAKPIFVLPEDIIWISGQMYHPDVVMKEAKAFS